MKIPECLFERELDLIKLVEENPITIPLPKVAKFLGLHEDSLRSSIDNGHCPFGISWQKTINGNRGYKIITYTFFKNYTINGSLINNNNFVCNTKEE